MTELETLQKYLQIRTKIYVETLEGKDLDIIESIPQEYFLHQMSLLVSRRVGEGELDIFCGYHKNQEVTKAIFLSLHPSMPIMLLEIGTVRERVKNFKKQNLPLEQSEEALKGWPN